MRKGNAPGRASEQRGQYGPKPGAARRQIPLGRCRDHDAVTTRTLRKCPGDDCTDNKIYHAHNPARRDDHLETASATKRCTCSAADRNTVTKRRRSMSRPEAPEALPGEAARRSCPEKLRRKTASTGAGFVFPQADNSGDNLCDRTADGTDVSPYGLFSRHGKAPRFPFFFRIFVNGAP